MRLILVRHGESEGNAAGVLQGLLDFGLTPLGRAQADALTERLKSEQIDRLIASPLRRAADTANIVAEGTGQEIIWDDALKEYDIGEASGLTGAQMREKYPTSAEAYVRGDHHRFPGEEGRDVFHARIDAFVQRIRQEPGTTLVIAHGGVVAAMCYNVLGLDPKRRGMFSIANCSITEVQEDRRGQLVLHRQNDSCHLEGIVTEVDRG